MTDDSGQRIQKLFREGKGAAATKRILELTLEAFTDVEMFKRLEVIEVKDILAHGDGAHLPKTIYHYRLKYLGRSISLIAYRDKGFDKSEPPQLGLFNDTEGMVQPISINELITLLSRPPFPLSASLEEVAVRSDEARLRITTAGPSHY